MRLAGIIALALGLSTTVAAAAALIPESGQSPTRAQAGSGTLLVEQARGTVVVAGKGVLVGRMDRGTLEIVDLSTSDQWSPRVFGIPRGKTVTLRGKNVSFYIPGGRYKLTAKGTGISVSARGAGSVMLDGDPDPVKDTGRYAIGDDPLEALPTWPLKLTFGPDPAPTSS
jgi:hypothetical protein